MTSIRPQTSRQRFAQYKKDFEAHETEGTRRTAAAHNKDKESSDKKRRNFRQLFMAFVRLLRGSRGKLAFALLTVTLATLLGLIQPVMIKIVVDNVLGDKPLPAILGDTLTGIDKIPLVWIVGGVMVVIGLISITIRMAGRWQATLITKRMQSKVRRKAFDHAIRLPLHRIHEMKSGGAASLLREDAGSVAELVFSMIYNPWRAITTLVGALIILAIVDWQLLIGGILLIPIIFVSHRSWIARIRPLFRDIRATRQSVDSHATEAFGGMRIVRGFGRQRTEVNRFIRNNHLMIRQELQAWWLMRTVDIAWAIFMPTATAALLIYGSYRVLAGALSTGDLFMFIGYLVMLLEPLATLAAGATAFQNSLAGLDRVLDVIDEPLEVEADTNARHLVRSRVAGRITLSDVSFVYPTTDATVLQDINLDVSPGEMIAFVGPSGAGKTTLCNLIARFYDPTTGTIALDGTDLREIDITSFRKLLGIVEQDIFLFDGTIAENIGYGKRSAELPDVRRAAELANATEFIDDLDQGFDTLIGERGVRLSGGQRQRLAIARAILADPKILILDEATSSLDTESERLIQQSLETLMRGRTSFVIAHRLSTITGADRIVVLEDGRIIEQGTHTMLMERSGRYRHMVELQCTPAAPEPAEA